MSYIDDTLKQAIMEEVITPNITNITIQAMLAIAKEYNEDEASLDQFRQQFVDTIMDICDPMVTGIIEAYMKIYNNSVVANQYKTRRDVDFLKTMMLNCKPMVVDGTLMHHSSAGMQAEYKEFIAHYNEMNETLYKTIFPDGEPDGYPIIQAPRISIASKENESETAGQT